MLSIDSGGTLNGYIGDICRVGFLGEPDSEMHDLLAEGDAIRHAAFEKIAPGALPRDVIENANAQRLASPGASYTDFFGHGMGIITREAPFILTNHPVTFDGIDAEHPLEIGMVLSIETSMLHPVRGCVKLEDTVAVTAGGYELYGAEGRGWNPGGVA